jgi:transglutaminase-like putative cysteine protease
MTKLSLVLGGLFAFVLAAAAHAEDPVSITRAATKIMLEADGTADIEGEIVIKVATDAAAQSQGQQGLAYSPSLETFEILSAETRKEDGRVLPVAPETIQERLLPAAANANDFDDRRNKIMVFPNVAAGDTLAIRFHRHLFKPYFPGHFSYLSTAAPAVSWGEIDTSISLPPGLEFKVELDRYTSEITEEAGRKRYRFHVENLRSDISPRAVGLADFAPHAIASTFASWDELSAAMRTLTADKIAVTDPIRQEAERITAGINDRREQARAIHDWVSVNIRYVNVLLGTGGFEPHSAETVLAKRYGDCKDHTVLFHALLAAKGIGSEMVLINLGNLYRLPDVVTLGVLNHMMSYLPEFDLYADTTSAVDSFGILPFQEYGKPVIHISSEGPVRRVTPILPANTATVELHTTATLKPNGTITGNSVSYATGPFAAVLRRAGKDARNGGRPWIEARLKALGEMGTGSVTPVTSTLAPAVTLSGQFSLDARPEYLDGEGFQPPVGLHVVARPGDYLAGQLFDRALPADRAIPCWSGRQVEDLTLVLPANRKLERLPKPVSLSAEGVTYSSNWAQIGQKVTVRREFSAVMPAALCSRQWRAKMAPLLGAVRADLGRKIALTDEP